MLLWFLGELAHLIFKPREILLAWDEHKIGTLDSLGLVGRLYAGVCADNQHGAGDALTTATEKADDENKAVALVDLPGLSDIQVSNRRESHSRYPCTAGGSGSVSMKSTRSYRPGTLLTTLLIWRSHPMTRSRLPVMVLITNQIQARVRV